VDTRDTAEQAELRRAARQLASELGPTTVADLDDRTRTKRLATAVRDAGWLELRDDVGDGRPLAAGEEAAIVAEALGGAVADVAFTGPVLAADLARRAGTAPEGVAVVACTRALTGVAPSAPAVAVDCDGDIDGAYVVVPEGDHFRLATVRVDGARAGADLTRMLRAVSAEAASEPVGGGGHLLARDDLVRWNALGLALTSADLVGVMRGLLDVTVAYASDRHQYGVPIGSFQAVQHLLAEAHTLFEGSVSVAQYASWGVDNLEPDAARSAGRVAKAYCARAARTVCETAVQVHGGIGNTWDCMVHAYLRRALLSTQWFGDDGEQIEQLEQQRLGVPIGGRGDGLP
jgi:alkylation response protein AidB-like acyl-CoA dehydrogenase